MLNVLINFMQQPLQFYSQTKMKSGEQVRAIDINPATGFGTVRVTKVDQDTGSGFLCTAEAVPNTYRAWDDL
jgi:hypothetical protein